MRWFELEVGYSDHPGMLDLARRLKNPLAEAYVLRLWAYCYDQELHRLEGPAAVAAIERAAGWRGRTGALVSVLLETKHLERDGAALIVHGVEKRLAAYQANRDAAAERQRKRREALAASRERHEDGHADVTRESRVSHGVSHVPTHQPTHQPTHLPASPPRARARSIGDAAAGGRAKVNLGPLGASAVARVAKGLRHALKPAASQADADEFEARIRKLGGVEPAVEYFAATCRTRDTEPEGVGLLLAWLRDLEPISEGGAS